MKFLIRFSKNKIGLTTIPVIGIILLTCVFFSPAFTQVSTPLANVKNVYHTIEVTRFDVDPSVDIPANQIDVLMLEIVDEIYKLKKFDQILKPSKNLIAQADNTKPTVKLIGTFTKYYALIPQKQTVESGDIWTHIRVQIKFIDAADGKVLLEKEVDRRIFLKINPFATQDVTRKVAREIAKITKKTFF